MSWISPTVAMLTAIGKKKMIGPPCCRSCSLVICAQAAYSDCPQTPVRHLWRAQDPAGCGDMNNTGVNHGDRNKGCAPGAAIAGYRGCVRNVVSIIGLARACREARHAVVHSARANAAAELC